MGTVPVWDPMPCVCCGLRTAHIDVDEGGFWCALCWCKADREDYAHHMATGMSKGRTSAFERVMSSDSADVIAKFVLGLGMDIACSCGLCSIEWMRKGWLCPCDYFRRELVALIDSKPLVYRSPHFFDPEWDRSSDYFDPELETYDFKLQLRVAFQDALSTNAIAVYGYEPDPLLSRLVTLTL